MTVCHINLRERQRVVILWGPQFFREGSFYFACGNHTKVITPNVANVLVGLVPVDKLFFFSFNSFTRDYICKRKSLFHSFKLLTKDADYL